MRTRLSKEEDRRGALAGQLLEDSSIFFHELLQALLEVGIGTAFSDVLGDRLTDNIRHRHFIRSGDGGKLRCLSHIEAKTGRFGRHGSGLPQLFSCAMASSAHSSASPTAAVRRPSPVTHSCPSARMLPLCISA